MKIVHASAVCLLVVAACGHEEQREPRTDLESSRAVAVLERFERAADNRNYVMVAAHRGSWWKDGEITLAENSLSSIERAIRIGADIVELDVTITEDNEYVVLHDETLDRTTTCSGPIRTTRLHELKSCRLVVEGTGEVTDEGVPRLEEVFQAIDGRVLLNIDSKFGIDGLADIATLAEQMGVADQLIFKAPVRNETERRAAIRLQERLAESGAEFMPVFQENVDSLGLPLTDVFAHFRPEAIEYITLASDDSEIVTADSAIANASLFDLAEQHDTRVWLNTIYHPKPGFRSGGRGDEMAVRDGNPSAVWGFWAEQGVAIFQTDEPEAAIEWLTNNGYRVANDTSDALVNNMPDHVPE